MGYEGTNRMKRFLMFALIMMVCLEGFSYQSTPVPQTFMIEKMPRAEFKFTSDTLKDINDFGSSATDNVYKAMTADSGGYEDDLTEDDRNLARGARFSISGVIDTYAYPTLTPYTGAMPGIKAFVAAVFGGIGSIPGAFIGGLLLGVIEILGRAYISSQMADAIVFAVLIVVLLVKPTGLLGKKIQEKV